MSEPGDPRAAANGGQSDEQAGCPSENVLGAYVEGRLEAEPEAAVLQHLDRCPGCRRVVAEALQSQGDTPAPDGDAGAEGGDDPPLAPGASAGRYQIRRLVGVGGMGSVYLAYDPRLEREVALKLLRPASSDEEREELHAWLMREAQAMARLSHPNVTQVHDVDALGERLAIAMEYVDGPTLRRWLRERPRAARAVLAIFLQAGAGLAAAHAAGLVHRDFKPDNVLIGRDGVARVTDFGLARAVRPEARLDEPRAATGATRDPEPAREVTRTGTLAARDPEPAREVTRTGTLAGTPAYMAPEQLAGRPADARADAFGFAVALYEALYGERPFAGSTVEELREATTAGRIREAPRGSRVPPRLRRVLLRALAPDPAARFPSMEALLDALAPAPAAGPRWLTSAAATLALAGMLAAFGIWRIHGRAGAGGNGGASGRAGAGGNGGASGRAATGRRAAVAVLGFRDRGGSERTAWLSGALSELLIEELGAGERLGLRTGESVARMKTDLALDDGAVPSAATLERIRGYLGVDYLVAGSYQVSEAGQLRFEARLQDATSGAVVATVGDVGEASAPGRIVARAAERLRAALHVAAPGAEDAAAIATAFPSDPEAARLYVDGLARLRALDPRAALEPLEKAATLAPDHAPIHAALARACLALGRSGRARDEARRAFDLSSRLGREERLGIEALYHQAMGRWDRVGEIARALWTFFPDKIDYGIRLADAQVRAGAPREALKTIAALRGQPVDGHAPEIGLIESNAWAWLSDFARTRDAAHRATDDARTAGARLAEANGLHAEAFALLKLGETDRAVAIYQDVRRRFRELGDHGHEVIVLNALATAAADRGDIVEARRLLEQVLAAAKADGNEELTVVAEGNLAEMLMALGDLAAAQPLLEQQLGRVPADGWTRGPLLLMEGGLLRRRGDLDGARRAIEEGLSLLRKQALQEYQVEGEEALALVLLQQGELRRARSAAEGALARAVSTGGGPLIARCRATLGEVLLGDGRPVEARAALAQAVAGLDPKRQQDDRMLALALLARAELASDHSAPARRAIDEAAALIPRTANRLAAREVELAADYLRAVTGPGDEREPARHALEAAIADAEQQGHVQLALAARLDLGLLEVRGGHVTAGRAALAALAVDADRRGFHLIGRRARGPSPARHSKS